MNCQNNSKTINKNEEKFNHDWRHCPYILIRKALRILDVNIPQKDDERVIDILEEYLRATGPAYWLKDLPALMKVLEIISVKCLEKPIFFILFEKMLKICEIPPLVAKSSESLEFLRDLEEYYSFLGYLLTFLTNKNLPNLERIIANSLMTNLNKNNNFPDNCVTKAILTKAIENSILPEIIAELFILIDDEIFGILLKFCLPLLENSDEICLRFLKQDCLNTILLRLEPNWSLRFPYTEPPIPDKNSSIQHYELISTAIWRLLSYLAKNVKNIEFIKRPKQFTLWSVKYALRYFILQKRHKIDRNNILCIILKLNEYFPKMDFVKSGIALELVQLNIASDLSYFNYPITNYELNLDTEDFQFRKMLLLSLIHFKSISGITVLTDEKIVKCLLVNLSYEQKVKWDISLHNKLIEIIINIFRIYIDNQDLREDYIENNGPEIILNLIEQKQDPDVLKACFEFLADCTQKKYNLTIFPESFQKITLVIMSITDNLVNKKFLTREDMYTLEHAFYFIKTILQVDTNVIESSLEMCLKYFKRYLEPEPRDQVHDPSLLISAVGVIWAIIELGVDVKKIVKSGLVYVLLDVLNITVFPVKIMILGALVDLADTEECISYLITWRKNGKHLLQLLMEIFREESGKLGVKTGPNGEIDDLSYPIMGKQQKLEINCNCTDKNDINPSISDMYGSCRPKIYALIQLIEKNHKEVTEISNEAYKLYNKELSTQDQLTMIVADNYLDLKIAEAWQELDCDLSKKFQLFYPDKFLVETIVERNKKWILQLQIAQKECLRRQNEKEIIKEYNFYQELKDCHLQPALQAVKEIKKQARTTERLFRVCGKITQNFQVKKTETPLPEPSTYHATYMDHIKVNPVFNQDVLVNKKIKHSIPCIRPVSPCQCVDTNLYLECEDNLSEPPEKC